MNSFEAIKALYLGKKISASPCISYYVYADTKHNKLYVQHNHSSSDLEEVEYSLFDKIKDNWFIVD